LALLALLTGDFPGDFPAAFTAPLTGDFLVAAAVGLGVVGFFVAGFFCVAAGFFSVGAWRVRDGTTARVRHCRGTSGYGECVDQGAQGKV